MLWLVLGTKPLSSQKVAAATQIAACYFATGPLASFRKVCRSIPLRYSKLRIEW
jgi:hypothetical protein